MQSLSHYGSSCFYRRLEVAQHISKAGCTCRSCHPFERNMLDIFLEETLRCRQTSEGITAQNVSVPCTTECHCSIETIQQQYSHHHKLIVFYSSLSTCYLERIDISFLFSSKSQHYLIAFRRGLVIEFMGIWWLIKKTRVVTMFIYQACKVGHTTCIWILSWFPIFNII